MLKNTLKVASDCLCMEIQLVLELFFKVNSLLNNKQNPSSLNINPAPPPQFH